MATGHAQKILRSGRPLSSPTEAQYRALQYLTAPYDVLTSDPKNRFGTKGLLPHVWKGDLPQGAFEATTANVLVSSPEFCLLQLSQLLDETSLLLLACELCGTYRRKPHGTAFNAPAVSSSTRIASFARSLERTKGCKTLRHASLSVIEGSASPMETELALRLTLPYRNGGFGLPMPSMNHPIEASPRLKRAIGSDNYRADLCWPDKHLIVEYDSDMFHTGGERIAKDSQRRMALEAMGYTVISVTKAQYHSPENFRQIAHTLARILGKRIRCDETRQFSASIQLMRELEKRR